MKRSPAHRAFAAWCAAIDPATIDAAWDRCNDSTKAAWQRVADALYMTPTLASDRFLTSAAAYEWILSQGFERDISGAQGWRWASKCSNIVARLRNCEDGTYIWDFIACPRKQQP